MVVLKIRRTAYITAIFEEPQSSQRQFARGLLMKSDITLRYILKAIGFLHGMTEIEEKEMEMVFEELDRSPGVETMLLAALRSAFDAELPIIFDWQRRESICDVKVSVAGNKMFLTFGSPEIDQSLMRQLAGAGASV